MSNNRPERPQVHLVMGDQVDDQGQNQQQQASGVQQGFMARANGIKFAIGNAQ
jgi:hypothetical protein